MYDDNIKGSVALFEIGGSHDECLFTQLVALKRDDRDVILITDKLIYERNPHFEGYIDELKIVNTDRLGRRTRISELRYLMRYMEDRGVTHLILNTAQGDVVRDLSLIGLFSSIEFIGIIHTTRKFKGSFTQQIINRKVRKYLLLSDYLLSTVAPPKRTRVEYFYPITFPSIKKEEHEGRNVTIIGGVETRRKDLKGFCQLLSMSSSDMTFTFLGKSDDLNEDAQWMRQEIEKIGRTKQVKLYNHFVSQEEFEKVLSQTDLILPLVHPDTPSADQYFRNQISGAMSISFGYKIPLLIHESYQFIEEMNVASFYYNLLQGFDDVTLDQIKEKMAAMKMHEPYQTSFQEERYLKFIFDR